MHNCSGHILVWKSATLTLQNKKRPWLARLILMLPVPVNYLFYGASKEEAVNKAKDFLFNFIDSHFHDIIPNTLEVINVDDLDLNIKNNNLDDAL